MRVKLFFLVGAVLLMSKPAYGQEAGRTLVQSSSQITIGDTGVSGNPVVNLKEPPAHKDYRGLIFTRKEPTGKKKWKFFKETYRIYQYELMDGTKFVTTTKVKDVPNLCELREEHPRVYRGLQVFGFAGGPIMNGIGAGVGSAAGK